MDPTIILAIVVMVTLLPAGYILGRRIDRQGNLRKLRAWQVAASQLGFRLKTSRDGSLEMWGQAGPYEVTVGERPHLVGQSLRADGYIEAILPLPLDLGLVVRRSGKAVRGDEPGRVRQLLDGVVETELQRAPPDLTLTDAGVRGRHAEELTETGAIVGLVETAVRLLAAVDSRRGSVMPAVALRGHLPRFEELAAIHGMTLELTPLSLRGRLLPSGALTERDGWIHTERRGDGCLDLVAGVLLHRPRQQGLHIAPKGARDHVEEFFGGQDIHVGVGPFDAAFRVRASAPQREVSDHISGSAQLRLLELLKDGLEPTVDDVAVRCRHLSRDGALNPDAAFALLDRLRLVADALEPTRPVASRGAYR